MKQYSLPFNHRINRSKGKNRESSSVQAPKLNTNPRVNIESAGVRRYGTLHV